MSSYKVLAAGDTTLVVDFGDQADLQVNAKVLSLARRLGELKLPGVIETIPTIRSLAVCYEPLSVSHAAIQTRIEKLLQESEPLPFHGRTWRVPICYDPELAPDIGHIAEQSGLAPSRVIELHSSVAYHVYMLGFLPGLAYLGDVPAELSLPRRQTPRPKVPAGSVGIAAKMTCIYPRETPCGWHLIGRSPVPLWDLSRETGALLTAGDKVQLRPLSLREYEREFALANSGGSRLEPIGSTP